MATKSQKVKTGVFLVACLALITSGLVVISGYYENPGNQYWIEFNESILGLYEGSIVEYLGVTVGKVQEIHVTENKTAHVEILIDPGKVHLQEGVEGQLVMYSIAAGTMAISLRGGNPDGKILRPGSEIPVKPSTIEAISSQIEGVMENIGSISESLKKLLKGLTPEDIREITDKVKVLLDDGHGLAGDAREAIASTQEDIDRVIDELTEVSEKAQALADDVSSLVRTTEEKVAQLDVGATQEQLQQLMENMTALSEQLNNAMGQFDDISASTMHKADNVQHSLNRALDNVGTTLESLNTFINDLRENPAALIRGKGTVKE